VTVRKQQTKPHEVSVGTPIQPRTSPNSPAPPSLSTPEPGPESAEVQSPMLPGTSDPTGLIHAIDVNRDSSPWQVMVMLIEEFKHDDLDEQSMFYKPHFEEPPLYKQSDTLTEPQRQQLEELKQANTSVLKLTLPAGIPPHREGDTPIAPTIPGAKPVKKPAYKLSPQHNLEVKRQLVEYIEKGFLSPSHSPWGAPVFLVKKPHSDKWRMVCDWRALNQLTIRDRFELPNPEQLFDKLSGAKWFTKLDLAQGYHQLPLSTDDRLKSAISTRYGTYEWSVASFGMTNVPSVFSRVLGNILFEYQDIFVINFLDDILIYTKSPKFEEHLKHIQLVLNKLKEAKLYANPEKCTWCVTSVPYLGHEISAEGIRCSKEKVQAVNDWPVPQSVKHVKQFLGMVSYYRKFIPSFAHIASPLHDLTKGHSKKHNRKISHKSTGGMINSHRDTPNALFWGPQHEQAFNQLKKKLTTHPILLWPDFSKPFTVIPDASGYAIGGALCQDHGEGLQPVAYESRKMIPAETRYPVHEQELLAILYCCKKWRHYILHTPTEVLTDHAPLKYLHTQPILSNRQARWLDFLAEYDLHICPQKGVENVLGDTQC
jgi:hypothetical protein